MKVYYERQYSSAVLLKFSYMSGLSDVVNSEKMAEKILTIDNMNPVVKMLEYAVRGPLAVRASQIQKELSTMVNN